MTNPDHSLLADTYPPAQSFKAPKPAPFEFSLDTVVVDELVQSPSIMAMLEKEIPYFGRIIQAPLLKPHLSNFTLRSMADFGIISPDRLEALDKRLRNWPVNERPPL